MTTTQPTRRTTTGSVIAFAVGGAAVSLALMAYASFKEDVQLPGDRAAFLWGVPITVAVTALVFLVVARVLRSGGAEAPARAALVFSLLALATLVVAFIAGLPVLFSAAATCCAVSARQRTGRWSVVPGVAVTLSAVAVAATTVLAIIG